MSSYKHIRQTILSEYKERPQAYRNKIIRWSTGGSVVRVDRPTNLARARKLGYKAKEGVVTVRVGVNKGSSKRKTPSGGRKPSKSGRYFTRAKSMQAIAEERAARRFSNCEVLNSYFIGESGTKTFFEIIMLDRAKPTITSDPFYSNVIARKNRAYRGITSSGRRHRGMIRQ
jgi:large subunit ribosomal protein L15e